MFRYILFLIVCFISACQVNNTPTLTSAHSSDALASVNTVLEFGEPVDLNLLQPLSSIMSNPDAYVEQRVTIKGKIDKVCKKKGCWADIVSGNETLRIKVADDVIVIPLYKLGHAAYATGVLRRFDMSLEKSIAYQKHMAKDAGEEFDPSTVTIPMSYYQLDTDAVKIL